MAAVERLLHEQFELGALSTGATEFYERLGWERWQGPSYVRDPDGLRWTPEEDSGLMVLRFDRSLGVDVASAISCEARCGDDW